MINESEKSALCSKVGAKRNKFRKLEVKEMRSAENVDRMGRRDILIGFCCEIRRKKTNRTEVGWRIIIK
jgi:hypothetical protein